MHHLTLHLTDAQFGELFVKSKFEGLSIDAYIKFKLFGSDPGVFTPKKAIARAMARYEIGDVFELRDLYSDEEWAELDRGERIAFGRNFFTFTDFIEKGMIKLVDGSGKNGRRAKYQLLKKVSNYGENDKA